MTSLASMSIGQQVMDSYGKKCNSKFLLITALPLRTTGKRMEDVKMNA